MQDKTNSADYTHFGYETIAREEKQRLVGQVFSSVASRYDIMNDVMSAGMHRLWKQRFVRNMCLGDQDILLDIAGGTGDISRLVTRRNPDIDIIVCDINQAMLKEGQHNAIDGNWYQQLEWLCANAESLPLPDNSVHVCSIAFGIRNVTTIERALAEIYRVLKPGGRFYCLEFSHMAIPALQKLYDSYSFHLIPAFGKWIAKDAASYQYLVESIRQFPDQKLYAGMLKAAGFSNVSWRNMTGGVVAMHSGWRI